MKVKKDNIIFKNKELLIFLLIPLFLFISAFYQNFINPYFIYSDTSLHYIFHHFSDVTQMRKDLFIDHNLQFVDIHFSDIPYTVLLFNGYFGISFLFSKILQPWQILNIWIILSFLLFLFASFSLSIQIFDSNNAKKIFIFLLITLFLSGDFFQGGIARTLAPSILIFSIYFYLTKKPYSLLLTFFISIYFYAQITPIITIPTIITFFRSSPNKKKVFFYFFLLFISIIAFYFYSSPMYRDYISNHDTRSFYSSFKFLLDSNASFLIHTKGFIFNYIFHFDEHGSNYKGLFLFFLLCSIILKGINLKYSFKVKLNKVFYEFLIYSIFLFLAFIFLGLLVGEPLNFAHLGGKSIKIFSPIFLSAFIASNLKRNARFGIQLKFLYTIGFIYYIFLFQNPCLNLKESKDLYGTISKLPKDSIILAEPNSTNEFIPFYASKSLFIMDIWKEIPGQSVYTKEVLRRENLLKNIKTLSSIKKVNTILENEKIDYILVDPIKGKLFHPILNHKIRKAFYRSSYNLYDSLILLPTKSLKLLE